MKPSNLINLLLLTISLLTGSCETIPGHREIFIINKSQKNIRFQIRYDVINPVIDCRKFGRLALADSVYTLKAPNNPNLPWEIEIGNSVLSLVFFNDEVYKKYYLNNPCDTVQKYIPIISHYQLTVEDLNSMNWIVVYPPEE